MKIKSLIIITLFLAACSTNAQNETANQTVSAAKFQTAIDSLQNEQILDVRTPQEWANGVIEDAILINWYDSNFSKDAALKLDKTKPILVYCASGGRSAKAMAKLNQMGYTTILNLDGGIGAWNRSGNKTVKP